MRTSRDTYKNPLGQFIQLKQSDQSIDFIEKHNLKLWNGFDYQAQKWIFEGKEDTRTLEELQASLNIN